MKPLSLVLALLLAACVQPAPGETTSRSSASSTRSIPAIPSVATSSATSETSIQSSSLSSKAVLSNEGSRTVGNPLPVPFMVQAPFANWDDPYQEACEEASLVMAHHFLLGSTSLTPEQANADLLSVIRYEEQNGYSQDVTIEQLATIARNYYDYRAIVENNVTVDRIQQVLDEGLPVIVPAAGRELGNPYFSGEGPWYHMLVITGYDSSSFITNDPGTKRGVGYRYDKEVLLKAIHDWTGVKEEIGQGKKTMLVLRKA